MKPDFNRSINGLLPVIIQDNITNIILMLGYMNEEAFIKTKKENRVTFFSRSKNRLWTKGETSKNYLNVISILLDCDEDTILIKVIPQGPVCHNGTDTCFNEKNTSENFLTSLEKIIRDRKNDPDENSYTSTLFKSGINKIAQKVGEEAVELIIEAKDNNEELFLNEAADLLYHYLILLQAKDLSLMDVTTKLEERNKKG
ncbi:MAG: bifunctional phosphoribosyl-AMP cyclohydrolase/phosphoribosyl-ATP diphosphatase HisIE [Bacteroidia bacterium]